jgi:hypothetical protein
MRDGHSLTPASLAALHVTLLGLVAALATLPIAACGGKAAPSDEAVNAYLDRNGLALPDVVAAAGEAASSADADPALGPIARRVAITVESGKGLPDLDSGPGETDPYVILEYEGQRHRTSVVEGDLEPIWGDTFIFDVTPGGVLVVKLMDEDALSSDELIGTISMPLPAIRVGESAPLEVSFRQGQGGTVLMTLTGMVRP